MQQKHGFLHRIRRFMISTTCAWWVNPCSKTWISLMTGLNHHQHEFNSCWMCLLPQKLGFACEEESAGSSPPCYKLDVDVMYRAAKSLVFSFESAPNLAATVGDDEVCNGRMMLRMMISEWELRSALEMNLSICPLRRKARLGGSGHLSMSLHRGLNKILADLLHLCCCCRRCSTCICWWRQLRWWSEVTLHHRSRRWRTRVRSTHTTHVFHIEVEHLDDPRRQQDGGAGRLPFRLIRSDRSREEHSGTTRRLTPGAVAA